MLGTPLVLGVETVPILAMIIDVALPSLRPLKVASPNMGQAKAGRSLTFCLPEVWTATQMRASQSLLGPSTLRASPSWHVI